MDRRIRVIIAVIISEAVFRLLYKAVPFPVSPLVYTLGVRLLQTVIILSLAFDLCGVKTRSLLRELLIGAGTALIFGVCVILADLLSRFAVQGGILKLVIARQQVPDPMLYFIVGCIAAPFAEELFFRGLFYSWLRERLPVVLAVVLSALAFACLHGFLSPVQIIGGLLFAVLFEWRKSIWAPYIVHAAANFGIWIFPWIYPFW